MGSLRNLAGPMRPSFLLLALACVVLGWASADWTSGSVSVHQLILVFVGGLCAHISVNAFNEYWDFRTGLDARTERTPFSGGSGTLQANPELAGQALGTAVVTFVVTAAIGLYFIYARGYGLLPLGIAGLVVIFLYTRWLTHVPFLCLVAPGLGFGTLMVMGVDFALSGSYSWTAFIASCVPFFLVNDLLLLNQFPDVEADRSVGRKHFPITIGRPASSLIYGSFLLAAHISIVVGVILRWLPATCLVALIGLAMAIPAMVGAYRHAEDMKRLIPFLALNVGINIVTPLLVAVGLFLG